MDQLHTGIEFEASYQPIKYFGIGALASFGNWTYLNDVSGTYKTYDTEDAVEVDKHIYSKDLKVGDMPQQQIAGVIQVYPIKGARIQLDVRHYSKHFADFNPTNTDKETDKVQVWETPAYMLVDFHFGYNLVLAEKYGLEFFGHIFNLLDEVYIQDAVDNSKYNSYMGDDDQFSHTVNSAEVYLGLPRRFNVGVKFTF